MGNGPLIFSIEEERDEFRKKIRKLKSLEGVYEDIIRIHSASVNNSSDC